MGILDKLWRRVSGGDDAERAELSGDLATAARLWARSGAVDEAARVMLLRGDAEPDPKLRLQHYTQAVATATEDAPVHAAAQVKRAKLVIALAEGATLSAARRGDVIQAARELEKAGEVAAAADAYALAGDTEGEARALTLAGDVDRLEALLSRDQRQSAKARTAHDVHAEVEALVGAGRRREALALAVASPDDPILKARAQRLQGARTSGPIVRVRLRGQRVTLVLGAEVTIGRADAVITIASSALSRKHVQLARDAHGKIVATDLGSRNGTQLRGLRLAMPLEVGEGALLTLGGEVPLALAPSAELPGAVAVEIGGERYLAPLAPKGDVALGITGFRLEQASDGWVELVTEGDAQSFFGDLVLASRVTLLRGDAMSAERGGEVVLSVEE